MIFRLLRWMLGLGADSAPPAQSPPPARSPRPVEPVAPPPLGAGPRQTPTPHQASVIADDQSRQPQSTRTPRPVTPVDPGRFAPLSRDESVKGAQANRSSWGWNQWWGRRDVVPPSSDARTELIDRTMVGQGMITPEELAQLHTIGDDMLRRRPDLGGASVVANEAVQASKDERAARKAQKKAAAAERDRQRQAAVIRRRATDIIFLGRGVSRGLADRRSHVEKLEQAGLPILSTPADVAAAIGVTIPRLRWLAFHHPASRTTHYTNFQVPKKSGGVRTLSSPKSGIRLCQSWIQSAILNKVAVADPAHGFAPGRSTLSNARPHEGAQIVINTDLSDFFPSITFWRVEGVFREFGYSPAVATVLALLCTESPRREVEYNGEKLHVATGPRSLPQGACTSPSLSNLVARRLDSRLAGITQKLGWSYTRYADDATFSSLDVESEKQVGYLLARIRHISQDEGFQVNELKTRILRKKTRQSVTGITVNASVSLPRETRRRLRAILHNAQKTGLAAQNRDDHPNFTSWVQGMIAYIRMVHPDEGQDLLQQFESLQGGSKPPHP